MNELSKSVRELKKRKDFFHFDQFIIQKMLGEESLTQDEITPETRKKAYLICLSDMGENRIVAIQTLQKWFGIHGRVLPTRENIFRLGFALHMTVEEVREYLVTGLCQQDFQINDYREAILIYGIGKKISYEESLDMIEEYERTLPGDLVLLQHNQTDNMLNEYELNCHLSKEDFLAWMKEHGEFFKGYSKTVLNYFKLYKEEILTYIKEDAEKELNSLLKQTNYSQWAKKARLSGKKNSVELYIRSEKRKGRDCISETMEKNLREMSQIASMSVQSNSELLLELYASLNQEVRNYKTNNKKDTTKKRFPMEINLMNDKYLSNVINIASHKERQLGLTILKYELEEYKDKEVCPASILDRLEEYGYKKKGKINTADARNWVAKRLKDQGRRCQLLQRNDLLPLILCVSQRRFLRENSSHTEVEGEEAGKNFVKLANATLTSCHMQLLQPERFEFDAIIMQCFQKDGLYFLPEVLEELVK